MSDHFFNKVDLIKMDTEGTENLILSGASKTLENFRPIVICETIFNTIEAELETIMRAHRYELYNHLPGGLKKVETIKRSSDDGVSNCFFIPSEKVELIREFVIE